MYEQDLEKKLIQQDPEDPAFIANPYLLYSRLHAIGTPVYWEHYGFWCLCEYDLVDRVLRDKRFARLPPPGFDRQSVPSHMQNFARTEKFSLLALERPEHTRLRKMVNRAFMSRQVNRMAPMIADLAHQCIDTFEQAECIELLAHYATPVPVTVIARLLGVPESVGKQLVTWSHLMVRVYTQNQTFEEEESADRAAAQFSEFVERLIDEKRQYPDQGLISQLVHAQNEDGPLSNDEIISTAILLLNAGHEATVHQLGNAINTLITAYPDDQRQTLLDLLANDDTADAVTAECLRYAAPLHMFMRFAQEDVELGSGVRLHKGDQVGLLLAAANRCPTKFNNPNEFQPLRTDAAHLSLGAGIHFCAGAQLAKLELRIILQVLFTRLPHVRLQSKPSYQNTYHFHGLKNLHLIWN